MNTIFTQDPSTDDLFWMQKALQEALKAFQMHEVPVGALCVFQGKLLTTAHNSVEKDADPTAHAELKCLRQAANILGRWRLHGVTLYSTLEPCPMCMGALISSRIDHLVWGAPDIRQGACGSLLNLLPHPIHNFTVKTNVLDETAKHLMKDFFKKVRKGKTTPHLQSPEYNF